MTAALAAPATTRLLFHWESPRRRRRAIAMFLILSVIAHAFCFYVFQIVYPPTVALLPPPARVSLITADSEEGRSLLRWIEAEDPALAFATHRPPEARFRALPKIAHVPSYLTREPILKEAPPVVIDLRAPSAHPPGPVPLTRRTAAPRTAPIPTAVSFSDELNKLGSPNFPAAKFVASNKESAQSVRFRVAVNNAGEIRHCFALESSGDPALDEQARNYLLLCRFPSIANPPLGPELVAEGQSPNQNSLVWGVATIEWGNDVARPTASPTQSSP